MLRLRSAAGHMLPVGLERREAISWWDYSFSAQRGLEIPSIAVPDRQLKHLT